MRRFLISSQNYTGQIELVYNESEQLVIVDFTNAILKVNQVDMFTRIIPATTQTLADVFGRYPQLTVVEGSFEVSFEAFWKKYDLKFNKIRTEKEWTKISPVERVQAYYSIEKYDKYVIDKRIGKAHPETYLRNKYFLNEY